METSRDLQSTLEKININNIQQDWRKMSKEFFENVGHDLLLPWLRCIKWARNTLYPGDLNRLLEACTKAFQNDDKFKSDIRYLKVWIIYADSTQDFDRIYSTMEANGIGIYHSLFYEAFATVLELQRKTYQANAVYRLGLSRQAQPIAKLMFMYNNFLKRMNERANSSLQKVTFKDDPYKTSNVQAYHMTVQIVSCNPQHPFKNNDDGCNDNAQKKNEFPVPMQDVEMHDSGRVLSKKAQDKTCNQENTGMGHLVHRHEGNAKVIRNCPPLNLCSHLAGNTQSLESSDKPLNLNECGKFSRKQGLNPWGGRVISNLLEKLKKQISKYKGYNASNKDYSGKTCLSSLRNAARNKVLNLGGIKYHIKGCSGEGAFAQVFKAHVDGCPNDTVALKIQRPACPWEFYMYRQLDDRIPSKERSSFGSAWRVHVYSDCSILVCDYVEHGTLQDVINSYLVTGQRMDEALCIYYTIEMLRMLEVMHSVGLIHGDLKPDNVLIRYASTEISEEWDPSWRGGWENQGLCLIDWGRGIDVNLFPSGTEFEADCRTSAFRCIEMQENRPWTFQVDTYGVCVIAHMMLHGSYMELVKETGPEGVYFYRPKAPFKRYWNADLWKNLFTTLLNIKSCGENPDLGILRKEFEDYLSSSLQLTKKLKQLLMKQRTVMCSGK